MRIQDVLTFVRQFSGKVRSDIYASVLDQTNPRNAMFLRQLEKDMSTGHQLDLPLQDLQAVVFDLETSGFHPEWGDKILSIGAVKMTGEQIHEEDTFYSLVRSNVKLERQIVELTGIDEEQLKSAPYLDEIMIRFLQYIKKHTLVAHHAAHEQRFMGDAMSRLTRGQFLYRIIDTSFLLKAVEPDLKCVTLDDCCAHCGIGIKDRHHALGDALATARLWSHYLAEARRMGFETLRDVKKALGKK